MVPLHERAKDLFLEALDHPARDRGHFVAEACGEDTALRAEVESLLQFHDESTGGGSTDGGSIDDGPPPPSPPLSFQPGTVFAGRYRMVTRIGRGGMGDVWRADDLVLETPVALKLIHSTGHTARQQILNEVRLARQITHPAVCRVFDVGEADGHVFLSMELVEGENLATLLRRVGRLPSEKVIDIARQLCGGLAAAHAQGVLHRDLKPANVLVDDEGRVRVTDFGIAVSRADAAPHAVIGTPGYMAPEQFDKTATLNEATDVYALGLILYELVSGQHAFGSTPRTSPPPRLPSRVPDVDPHLAHAVQQALQPHAADRPASALHLAALLPSAANERRPVSRAWLAAVAAVVLAGAAAIGWSFLQPVATRPLTSQDTIVLADFTNTTGEPVFDGALKVALAVALEQSPFLKVFPDERIAEALRLMGRPIDTPVTRAVAREIAQRERLNALLSGSIAGLGRNYVVTLEAINPPNGDVMAREQIEAGSKEDVLTALGTAAARLRTKLGESLAQVQRFDVPLPRATTPSLEALKAYSMALDDGTLNPSVDDIPHLRRAIELDPDFALALALLAGTYANTGQTSLAPAYAKRAFDLRDRVSERERYFIAFRYYRDATQDWSQALELSRSWTSTYPREAFAFNSLGTALSRFGQYADAVAPLREAIRLDPRFESPYANLAGVLMALGRFDEARAVLKQAADARLTSFPVRRLTYLLAVHDGDAAVADQMFRASIGAGVTNAAYGWQGHTEAYGGRVRRAHDAFRQGTQMAAQNGFPEVSAQLFVEDAEVHALYGQCGEARGEVAQGLALSRDNYTLERASRTLALCGDSQATALARELADRFPEATITQRLLLPVTEALVAERKGQPARVLALLADIRPLDRGPRAEFWPEYLRGAAYLALRDGGSAAREFKSILEHRGEYPNGPLYPFAQLGLARGLAFAGDLEAAREAYAALFRTWSEADSGLAPVDDAHREDARLR